MKTQHEVLMEDPEFRRLVSIEALVVYLLTIIGAHHPLYRSDSDRIVLPPVDISRRSSFGLAEGSYNAARPLKIYDPLEVLVNGPTARDRAAIAARSALDARFASSKPNVYRERLDIWTSAKQRTYQNAETLADPLLDLSQTSAAKHGFTNADLLEIFSSTSSPSPYFFGQGDFGSSVPLALRFLELGSPACVAASDNFDFHFGEIDYYPRASADLVRQLAGLRFVLTAMAHDSGGTFWERAKLATAVITKTNNAICSNAEW